ncbi:hypothetical protein ACTMU2_18570 [Cupriavidus basilensis]
MEHNVPLITTLAAGFGIALVLGFLAERIKVPALVVRPGRRHHHRPGHAGLCR